MEENKQENSSLPINELEKVRLRLAQVAHSLVKLYDQLVNEQKLPVWSSLQNQLNVILTQLTSLSSTIDLNHKALQSINVYPTTEFPAVEQEGLLTTLLRKKPLPEVSEWINGSIDQLKHLELNSGQAFDFEKSEELLKWCEQFASESLGNSVLFGYQTSQELSEGLPLADEFRDDEIDTKTETGLEVGDIYRFIYQGKEP